MKLNTLLHPFMKVLPAWQAIEIENLTNDSRQVKAHDLFIAYPGHHVDGRQFIHEVIQQGAVAVLYDPKDGFCCENTSVPTIAIENLFEKMGEIAAHFYGDPTQKLTVIGITGTNGKTTTAYQLAAAYTALTIPTAYMGTLGYGVPPDLKPLLNTTPDGLYLQQLFASLVKRGIKQVCMEVSSHALAEQRIRGIVFERAIFTNLTPEHLDFHHTMENYQAAKGRLFAMLTLKAIALNQDDASHLYMASQVQHPLTMVTYGLSQTADLQAKHCHYTLQGTHFALHTPKNSGACFIPVVGEFNLYNALAVAADLYLANYAFEVIQQALKTLPAVVGRLEVVTKQPWVIVDFAHTPDALEKALKTLKALHQGPLSVIFGCGGERDAFKRPIMGKIAAEYADEVILTNDNPRSEDPSAIIQAIQQGITSKTVTVIPDRKAAILHQLNKAKPDELILIAGKGHEKYQEIKGVRTPFSDQTIVLEALT